MNRLILNKLIVQGISYRRTIEFDEHLTIISGEKTSGKSLILSLIDYCFGKSSKIDLNVQPELDAKCDQIFLEIKINDEVITLNRMLKEKQSKISIYFCPFESLDEYTPKTLDIQDAMKILMHKLNINEYKLIRHQKHSNKKEIDTVSFRDIFRYVYVHQHQLGTGDFLEKKSTFKANKNPHAFKMMFNLVDVDKDALNEQLIKVQNDIEETRRELFGLNSYLKDLDADNRIELQAKTDKLQKEIEEQKHFKILVLENSRTNRNKNNENKMYIKLKKDSNDITNKIFNYQREKRQLQLSIASKKLLLDEYQVEEQEVEETLELNYKLIIPQQSIECPLCSSRVTNHLHNIIHQSANAEVTLNNIKKQIKNKINLVNDLIDKERQQIEELDANIDKLSRKQTIFNEAIIEYSKETDVPFLSQINSINVMINRLVKDQEILKEGLRIHHKIDEKNKLIEDLKAAETRLIKDIDALKVSVDYKEEVFRFLNNEYKAFMKRLKYDTNNETYIHEEQMIPYYNGASVYAHESGGLLECMQLSFLGAILLSKTKGYGVGHPGLLLLDSLSKYVGTLKTKSNEQNQSVKNKEKINDPEVYEEFYKILVELSDNHQIILVENTPPDQYDEIYTKYTFYTGDKGFIDEEQNEISDFN
jgi:DNA repair exonuclease SbcCD ATPase subunit